VIEWLIDNGRDLGDLNKKGRLGSGQEFTALEIAREMKKSEVVSLLERFFSNPAQTRQEIRHKLSIYGISLPPLLGWEL